MILKYNLPQDISLQLTEGERIYYTVPFDIAEDGSWLKDSYLVVTSHRIFVIREKQLERLDYLRYHIRKQQEAQQS